MRQLAFVIAFAAAAFAGAAIAQAPGDPKPAPPGPTDPLNIVSAGGKVHAFKVELADTPQETELGLMYRPSLPRDGGMIFDFGQPRSTGMWMKNCLFPQDMLFLGPDGAVLAIAQNARPGSERIIDPGFPVKGVLELNGGITKELGIKPGDKIQHKIFGNLKAN